MSNDLEQPSSSSDGVVPSDLGGSVVNTPGDPPVGAEEKVPLPKEEEPAPKPRGRPRVVKKKPIEETKEPPKEDPVVTDPMFFAGLNATMKMMVQQERRHRLSSMATVVRILGCNK